MKKFLLTLLALGTANFAFAKEVFHFKFNNYSNNPVELTQVIDYKWNDKGDLDIFGPWTIKPGDIDFTWNITDNHGTASSHEDYEDFRLKFKIINNGVQEDKSVFFRVANPKTSSIPPKLVIGMAEYPSNNACLYLDAKEENQELKNLSLLKTVDGKKNTGVS